MPGVLAKARQCIDYAAHQVRSSPPRFIAMPTATISLQKSETILDKDADSFPIVSTEMA